MSRTLDDRLQALERALIPPVQKPPAISFPAERVVLTRAYLVLAHAEFQASLEDLCRRTASIAKRKLAKNQITTAAISLVSWFPILSEGKPPSALPLQPVIAPNNRPDIPKRIKLSERFDAAFAQYEAQWKDNNGIKQHNLLSLLVPLGVDHTSLSGPVLLECDKLGKERGNLAHGRAQQVIDPHSEQLRVRQLFKFFADELPRVLAAVVR